MFDFLKKIFCGKQEETLITDQNMENNNPSGNDETTETSSGSDENSTYDSNDFGGNE